MTVWDGGEPEGYWMPSVDPLAGIADEQREASESLGARAKVEWPVAVPVAVPARLLVEGTSASEP